jgi:thioredoxin reductase (NADPH)
VPDSGARRPLIVLVAPEHASVLDGEFIRYAPDYDIRCTRTAAATSELLRDARAAEDQAALLVTESQLPDTERVAAAAGEGASVIPLVHAHLSGPDG